MLNVKKITTEQTAEEKQQTNEEEILEFLKQDFISSIVKNLNVDEEFGDEIIDKEHLKKCIKILKIQDFIHLPNEQTLLGLDDYRTFELSYTERKALLHYVEKKLEQNCLPIVKYFEEMERKYPEIFSNSRRNDEEMLKLLEKRRNLMIELTHTRNEKCKLLRECTDLKLGPQTQKELELLFAEMELNESKAKFLELKISDEITANTSYSSKAIQEIEGYLDEMLNNE